jgi:hypothetical protein
MATVQATPGSPRRQGRERNRSAAVIEKARRLRYRRRGQTITCKVQASGAAFAVSGTLYSSGNGATIEISVVIGPGQDNIPGAVAVTDGANRLQIDERYPPSACMFSVKPSVGENLSVASGRVWGKVTCTNLGIRTAAAEACDLTTSYFILENCDQ